MGSNSRRNVSNNDDPNEREMKTNIVIIQGKKFRKVKGQTEEYLPKMIYSEFCDPELYI